MYFDRNLNIVFKERNSAIFTVFLFISFHIADHYDYDSRDTLKAISVYWLSLNPL